MLITNGPSSICFEWPKEKTNISEFITDIREKKIFNNIRKF